MRQDLLLRQRPVILLHLLIMAHPGVQFRVPNQQIRHLGVVSALGVAGQGPGVILFQFVVHPAAIEHRPALFFRILPLHLPQKESAELGPKAELLNAVIPQHGCVPLEPIQHLSRVGISAYHAGHFQIKGLKGSQLQQKPPDSANDLTWQEANDIEKILVDVDELLTRMAAWFYSGELYAGEV